MQLISSGTLDINQLQTEQNNSRNADKDTNDGNAFFGGTPFTGATSKYTHVQFFNPASSGVYVLVDRILFTVEIGDYINVRSLGSEISGDFGTQKAKEQGLANSKVKLLYEQNTSNLGSSLTTIPANPADVVTVTPKNPFRFNESESMLFISKAVNENISVYMEWREILL